MLQLLNLKIYFQVTSPCKHVARNHPGTAKLFCLQASDENTTKYFSTQYPTTFCTWNECDRAY